MSAKTLSLVVLVVAACATATDGQDVVRLAAGARLTDKAPPGTMLDVETSFTNPSGSISGTLSASVSRSPAGEEITRTLRQSVVEAKINNASFIMSSSQDIEALAEGLRFDPEERTQLLTKTSDRSRDSDVIAIKAIAKSALDTEEVVKLARVMVESTIHASDITLETELIELLGDRELMTAILFADPVTQFVPDEDREEDYFEDFNKVQLTPTIVVRSGKGRSSSRLARSESTAFTQGNAVAMGHSSAVAVSTSDNQPINPTTTTVLTSDDGRRRKLLCDACSPVNSFVCAHCWPRRVCVNYAWCRQAARNSRRGRQNRRRNRNRGG